MATGVDQMVPGRKSIEKRDGIVVRFAGDSGDGMQLTGMQFTTESVFAGNDVVTLPEFPAEIRAPAGTLYGVSSYQLNFSSRPVFTPGDDLDALVAMNPAALKAHLGDLKPGGIIIADRESFSEQNLKKAGYTSNPLEDGSLGAYQLFPVDITRLTTIALRDLGMPNRAVMRCRNFFTLGLVSWVFHRPVEPTVAYIRQRFRRTPELIEANIKALNAGYNVGENTELFAVSYDVKPAAIAPGTYRNVTGNSAIAIGLVAAATKAGLPLFLGSYPITPASDVLHELAAYKNFNVYTFQAEDEIAGVGAALGAAFGGAIAVTTTSGPGMNLKAETIGLAASVELPLVIVNVQRAGPSTGMPTKPEQSDLLQALYGRHGDAPVVVLAARTPKDCFYAAYEAVRLAVKYMTPVIVLSDGYLANGAESWAIPRSEELPEIVVKFREDPQGFFPYLRDETTLARPWVRPGTPGLEHRVGGLERDYVTGNVSYVPTNHEQMVRVRYRKLARMAREFPPTEVVGPRAGRLLVVGWGGTYGSIAAAVQELHGQGKSVAHVHLRCLNPLPPDLGEIISRYEKVLVPEMNMGQLRQVLRAEYLVDAIGLNKIQGRPFKVSEIVAKADRMLEE